MKIAAFVVLCFLLPGSAILQAQQGKNAGQKKGDIIQWVDQYPSKEGVKKSFLKIVDEFIFGADPQPVNKPNCSLVDPQGALWILNQGNGIISRFEAKRVLLFDDRKKGAYPSLVSACYMKGKGLAFTDSYLNKVFLISEESRKTRTFIENDSLLQPTGIAYSPVNDEVWIIETSKHRILVYSSDGTYRKTIGKRGSEPGCFNYPTHLWIDKEGRAYIVDAMNFRVQIFSSSGAFISTFGSQGTSSGSMGRPKGIATDSHGNIYIADALFNTVQIFNAEGDLLYYFGSHGTAREQFWMPSGIFIDEKDYIYVSDSYNNRVQVFQLHLKE